MIFVVIIIMFSLIALPNHTEDEDNSAKKEVPFSMVKYDYMKCGTRARVFS